MVIGITTKAPRALQVRFMVCALLLLTAATGLPAATPISPIVTYANTTQAFVVNGAFGGDDNLAYEATLYGGDALPSWMKFDSGTGTFSFRAPAGDVGKIYRVTVTATDDSFTSFYVLVDDDSYSCQVEANTDHRGQVIDCATGTVQLHGETSANGYQWSGPNGFSSTKASPYVSAPGLYVLTTTASSGDCPRKSIVEVVADCSTDSGKNLIPVGRIKADRTEGSAPLSVQFDATASADADGKVIDYNWYWDGGYASGSRPDITFPEGSHEVILVVTDQLGARSTDRITIKAGKEVAETPTAAGTYWLEAECAEVGSGWKVQSSGSASEGAYVVNDNTSTGSVPSASSANMVRFSFSASAGTVNLFARVDAPNNTSDSYYVRVNGGSWITWNSGFDLGRGYQWNRLRTTVTLRDGGNTVDFLYRESGTKLDKIVLKGGTTLPSGTGSAATNCGGDDGTQPSSPTADNFWLEAECAQVGDRWSTLTNSGASAGQYVVVRSGSAMTSAPADTDGNRVRFAVNAKSGDYKLHARIGAPSNVDDSFWVRVNGGSWYKWASGIDHTGNGFAWNTLPKLLGLRDGANTIDFAFREDGTRLDKIYLTKTGGKPSNMGQPGTNCGAGGDEGPMADDGPRNYWLEAECGQVGSGWTAHNTGTASGGRKLSYEGSNSTTSAPASDARQQLKFEVSVDKAATYHLFLRMEAADRASNSFWVRVDNGSWVKFWKEGDGTDLLTQGTQWRRVAHDGKYVSFPLGAGEHTIIVANREAGTQLDKLLLSTSTTTPTGFGGAANNCSGSSSQTLQMMNTTVGTTEEEVSGEPVLSVYPNPASVEVTVDLTSGYAGRVDIVLTDVTGRRVQQLQFDKAGDQLRTPIDVSALADGMYYLRVVEGDRQTVRSFAKH